MDADITVAYWSIIDEGNLGDALYFDDDVDVSERPDDEVLPPDASGVRLARAVGWLSIGLGIAQLVMPHVVERVLGVRSRTGVLMRLLGAGQLASGLGLLAGPRHQRTTEVRKAITIDASPIDVYRVWRMLELVPQFMTHIRKVERLDAVRSRWTADGPAGTTMQWEAEIIDDRPGEMIAWTTLAGPFDSCGVVRFLGDATGRRTEVVVEMEYGVPGGGVGRAAATALGYEPGAELERGLRRLAQMFEPLDPL
jgi:uncharacterized membrane protein